MARSFNVPTIFNSEFVSKIKTARRDADPLKNDLSPSILDFGPLRFKLARHFGFCYGVENAIEIAYRAVEMNPDKRIFLLSEMIHNPRVNDDLVDRGIRFLRTTDGKQLIPFAELLPNDIVIIPAFGTTIEIETQLRELKVDIKSYDTTCPFVEKVWRRASQIGSKGYTVIVHGKRNHEETQATFSRARQGKNSSWDASMKSGNTANTPVFVVRDLEEATFLADFIRGKHDRETLLERFLDSFTPDFDPDTDLIRIGVVNQTTMLATETKEISSVLRQAMSERFGESEISRHFADTSDTLCYATNENQEAARALINDGASLAIVVGGSNSSNTSHLVELCSEVMPTYFIRSSKQIDGAQRIVHFDLESGRDITSESWLDLSSRVDILLTAGASCPDILLDEVIRTVVDLVPGTRNPADVLQTFTHIQTAH